MCIVFANRSEMQLYLSAPVRQPVALRHLPRPSRRRVRMCRPTTRWSRPGQPGVGFRAILALAGRAAHLEAVRRLRVEPNQLPGGATSCVTRRGITQ
jgi:hypothetical protein